MGSKLASRGAALGVALVVGTTLALADPPPMQPTPLEQAERRADSLVAGIERLSFPASSAVGPDLLSHETPRTSTSYSGVPDLNRDGYADVLGQTRASEKSDPRSPSPNREAIV